MFAKTISAERTEAGVIRVCKIETDLRVGGEVAAGKSPQRYAAVFRPLATELISNTEIGRGALQ
eukprot:SAG31_NODE_7223_length_1750_cov_2.334343_2_plen_64_part_00